MTEPGEVQAGGRRVEVPRPEKLLFPGDGLRKMDVARYYLQAAPLMRPFLAGRPLVLQRFPDGIQEEGFYQKRPSEHFPAWLPRVEAPLAEGGSITMLQARDAAALVYLAAQGVVTFHAWLSREEDLPHPDQVVWDLDPPPRGGFGLVRDAARRLGELLEKLGLAPFVKTTGSRGLHVVCPLRTGPDYERTRDFARRVAELLASRHPDRLTTAPRLKARGNRLFLDYLRNGLGQTAVAPYSLRALPGAPVAAPLDWGELERGDLTAQTYNLTNIFRRMGQKEDPWRDLWRHARSLDGPREALAGAADQEGRERG
ncbi:MAG: non-homologous end-joining DNA ligase [Deltaproteobacteria bacterium]|nr:non-homologous end-joining DNA ligase [Deltaproteobacteria bacterium]